MKTRTFTTMGALHPVLFFVVIYFVALLFSIFICSSLFYSCNTRSAKPGQERAAATQKQTVSGVAAAAIVMR